MFGGDDEEDLFGAFETAPVEEGLKRPATGPTIILDVPTAKRAREGAAPVDMLAKSQLGGVPASVQEGEPALEPTGKTCKHEVAMPEGQEPTEDMINLVQPGHEPARSYKFELDPFQKAAVACIERDESVLVSAHTSAGKTVCAEYAIATGLRDKQRVIYTSPIKALSNQKYRELMEDFGDVGLMTGDVTINVEASCLVMTTEILRSMLYRGSEVMREVKWVIFDEVHYMRDKERGVVWEEVMILLPRSVRYVMLSATVPNALEFAQWIASLHLQPCHVVYTGYRPTPLQHYIFPSGGDGMHLVVDENATFKANNFAKAIASIKPKAQPKEKSGKGKGKGGDGREMRGGPSDCFKLIKMVVEKGLDPLIVFAFGKKMCEALARQTTSLQLNTSDESAMVAEIFKNAIDTMTDDDKSLPQVEGMLPLLQRGVAVHHSGLLPILKELVEILFQENLVKLLFATETFAMGLNMPARTVIFASLSKFDGGSFRYLSSGEYIQMSGRAGRRGLDSRGLVIQISDERTDTAKVREMLTGKADTLSSKFHLSYNMLLNCVRVETADVETLIQKSFYTFQQLQSLPVLQAELAEVLAKLNSPELKIPKEARVAELHAARLSQIKLRDQLRAFVNQPIHALPFIQAGRLAQVRELAAPSKGASAEAEAVAAAFDWGWGVIVNFRKGADATKRDQKAGRKSAVVGATADYQVDMLLPCMPGADAAIQKGTKPQPASSIDDAEMHVISVPLTHLDGISSIRLKMPPDLRSNDSRFGLLKVMREVHRRYPDGLPLLAPKEEMQVAEEAVPSLQRKIEAVQSRLSEGRLTDPEVHEGLPLLRQRLALCDAEQNARAKIKACQDVLMQAELKGMRRVLRRMGHISEEGVIQNKGRVACEVSTCDELLATELMFSGVLNELEPPRLAALLSCLVVEAQSSSGEGSKKGSSSGETSAQIKTVAMREPFDQLRDLSRRIATVVEEARLPIEVEDYVNKCSHALVDIVIEWCNGAKFVDIARMTDWYEGSIIRTLHRLEELLRQMIDAAKVVGNEDLEKRCAEARKLLVRDVVFAASLYT